MEARTRDMLFGTGRGFEGLRGTFAPAGEGAKQKGDILASYQGPGKDKVLGFLERRNFISAEQRAANGAAASAVDEVVGAAGETRGLVGASGATAAAAGQQYANPVYGGLMAQTLMREQGFVPPTALPDGALGGGVADEVRLATAPVAAATTPAAPAAAAATDAPIAAAADDVAARVADLEQRMLTSLQRLGELPQDAKVPTLARAVDATAQHGGDSYDVLSRALLERPLEDSVVAFERSLDDAVRVAAPVVDDAAKVAAPVAEQVVAKAAPVVAETVAKAAPAVTETVAKAAAPVADDVAEAVAKALPSAVEAMVPRLAEAMAPRVAEALAPKLLLAGSDDVLRAGMSFSAGVDDTLRLLAKF